MINQVFISVLATVITMPVATQCVAILAGVLLLTAVLLAWRYSVPAAIRLMVVQGAALACLVGVLGLVNNELDLLAMSVVILVLKAGVLPWVLLRAARLSGVDRESNPRIGAIASMIAATALIVLAFLVGQPLATATTGFASKAAPVGLALVFTGFLILVTRSRAASALVGFLMLDNGIAVVTFLVTGGLPLVVELGVLLDVLLVVLILQVLTSRMPAKFGGSDLEDLKELHD